MSWHGIMKVLEVRHVRNNQVVWEDRNIRNILHTKGEEFFLKVLFNNDGSLPQTNYYFGLDNRLLINVADVMSNVEDEPSGNGYARQTLSSATGFTIELKNGINRALGSIVTFSATGVGYGPVRNIFLTDKIDNTGTLISTVVMTSPATLAPGDSLSLRMALSLRDCP